MKPEIITTASFELKKRWDYIRKMDGIRFLKSIFGDSITAGEALQAWKLAYD